MKIFKNKNELEKFLLYKCRNAVYEAEQEVYAIIDSCLNNFYGEYEPAEYIRTKQLFYSLVMSEVKQVGNGYVAEVYFDASKLNYKKGDVLLKSGNYGWATWSNEKVLDVAMTDNLPHGRWRKAEGTPIWTESMRQLGDIYMLLIEKLKKQGIPIK